MYGRLDSELIIKLLKEGDSLNTYKNIDKKYAVNPTETRIAEVERIPAPPIAHQLVSQRLEHLLIAACKQEFILIHAPIDLIFGGKILQPDIVLIHKDRTDIIGTHAITGPPNVIIEILSKTSIPLDCNIKKRIYAELGVLEYWIVDYKNKRISVYECIKNEYQLLKKFTEDEVIHSKQLSSINFTLSDCLK